MLIAGLLYAGEALLLLPLALAEAPGNQHAQMRRADLPFLALITWLGGIARFGLRQAAGRSSWRLIAEW